MSGRHSRQLRVPWPPLEWESQWWSPPPGGLTRRGRTAGRYRSAVVPTIADAALTLPDWLAADLDDATQQIVHFDGASSHQAGVLTSILIRSESASSSQIEQITASARAVAEAEVTGLGSRNAAVIAANVRTMNTMITDERPLDVARIESIQAGILEHHSPTLVGWRSDAVWIGGPGSTPVDADYVGPSHERIPGALADLVRFVDRDDLPVLAQAAIAHAQFETIHPFADGNGRTGRALVHLVLRGKGLTRSVTIPISAGLLADKDGYFQALGAYRSGDAAPILSAFCSASIRAVEHGQSFADRVEDVLGKWRRHITARSDSAVWKILDVLPAHPVADAEMLAHATGGDARNIHRSLRRLTSAGVLVESRHHKSRRMLFRAPDILRALDEYAETFGRRSTGPSAGDGAPAPRRLQWSAGVTCRTR